MMMLMMMMKIIIIIIIIIINSASCGAKIDPESTHGLACIPFRYTGTSRSKLGLSSRDVWSACV